MSLPHTQHSIFGNICLSHFSISRSVNQMSRNFCHDRFTCGNFIISVCGRIQLQYDCSSRSLDATHILRRVGKNRKIVLSKLFCRCKGYLGTISTVRCVVNVILSKYPILYPIVLQQQVSSISHYLICDCANRFTLRRFYIYVMSRSWYVFMCTRLVFAHSNNNDTHTGTVSKGKKHCPGLGDLRGVRGVRA